MQVEVWKKIEEFFRAAQALPPQKRSEFLNQACPDDPQIRAEVQSLLDAAPGAASFLEGSPLTTALMPGSKLGHFEILELLGRGGMGEVYRARDSRLKRDVAIKVLPVTFARDPDRMARFEREARAAGALNHPNITSVYEIGLENEADGIQFIAMEYVAGKTLDQLIGRKGLRLSESLTYAVQIADALARAHNAGIIHRDLKPSNIMVDEHGLVKVLDFGLAKLTEAAAGKFVETATLEVPDGLQTDGGAIVGTGAYMSPEQAEGKLVDFRSDIFSFGSVLYEIVTGQRAFHRDSTLSTLSAILKEEPKPVSSLTSHVPRDLEKIILCCLRKDPERRFQSMADLRVALAEVKEEYDTGTIATSAAGTVQSWRKTRAAFGLSALAIVIAASAGIWFGIVRPASRAVPEPKVVPLTSYPGRQMTPALSPDGKQVAFSWNGEKGDNFDIYVKLVDAGTPLRLTSSPASELFPAWSPDGRYIAFYREIEGNRPEIMVVPALGNPERKLGQLIASRNYFTGHPSWSLDGNVLALVDKRDSTDPFSIFLLAVETGNKRRLTSPPPGYYGDCQPAYSPDGKTIAFARFPTTVSSDLYVVAADGGEASIGRRPRRLTHDEQAIYGFDWTADGRNLVFSSDRYGSRGLWRIPASGGEARRVPIAGENAWAVSIARNGRRLVYERALGNTNIWRTAGPTSSDHSSVPVKWIASTQQEQEQQFAPDGTRIVFSSNREGSQEIWVCDRYGRNPVQLTSFEGPSTGSPRWSPDSRWIAFDCPKEGNTDIYVINAEGGQPRRLTRGPFNNKIPSWSTDGRWIYFSSNRSGRFQIWKIPAEGGAAVQVTRTHGGEVAFESDEKFVYFAKPAEPGIWRVPAMGGEETRVLDQVPALGWALSGKGICFFDVTSPGGPVIKFYELATRKQRAIHQFPKDTIIHLGESALSVSPDGRWILYTQVDQAGSDLILVDNFR